MQYEHIRIDAFSVQCTTQQRMVHSAFLLQIERSACMDLLYVCGLCSNRETYRNDTGVLEGLLCPVSAEHTFTVLSASFTLNLGTEAPTPWV